MPPSTLSRTRGQKPIDLSTCQKDVIQLYADISKVAAQVANRPAKDSFDAVAHRVQELKPHTDKLAQAVDSLIETIQKQKQKQKRVPERPGPRRNDKSTQKATPSDSCYDGPVKFGHGQMNRAIVPTIQRVLEDRPEYREHGWFKVALEKDVVEQINPTKISNSVRGGLNDHQSQMLLHRALNTRDQTVHGRVSKVLTDSSKRAKDFTLPNLTDLSPDMIEPDCYQLLRSTVGNATKPGKRISYYVGPADSSPEWRDSVGLPQGSFLDCGDRLRMARESIAGVHTAYEYVSTESGSSTAMHIEDACLGSMNVVLAGASKVWLFVPPSHREKLEAKLRNVFPADVTSPLCSQFVRHLDSLFSPDLLGEWDIPYETVACRAGEMVVTLSGTYHLVVNAGPNIADAVNFAENADWNVLPGQYQFCSAECPLEYPLKPEDLRIQDPSSGEELSPDGSSSLAGEKRKSQSGFESEDDDDDGDGDDDDDDEEDEDEDEDEEYQPRGGRETPTEEGDIRPDPLIDEVSTKDSSLSTEVSHDLQSDDELNSDETLHLLHQAFNIINDDPDTSAGAGNPSYPESNDSSPLEHRPSQDVGSGLQLHTPPSDGEFDSTPCPIPPIHIDHGRNDTSKEDPKDKHDAPMSVEGGLPSADASSADEAQSNSLNDTNDDFTATILDSNSSLDHDFHSVDLKTGHDRIEWIPLIKNASQAFFQDDTLMRLLPGKRLNDAAVIAILQRLLPKTCQVLTAKESVQQFPSNGLAHSYDHSSGHSPILRYDENCNRLFIVDVRHGSSNCNDDGGGHWVLIIVDLEYSKVHVFAGTGYENEATTLARNIGDFVNNYRTSSDVQLPEIDWQDPQIKPLPDYFLHSDSYNHGISVILRADEFMHPETSLLSALGVSSKPFPEQLDSLREHYLRMFTKRYEQVCSDAVLMAHLNASPLASRKRRTPDSPLEDRPPDSVKISRSLFKSEPVPQPVEFVKLESSRQWEDCLVSCAKDKGFDSSRLIQVFRDAPNEPTGNVLRALQCMCEVACSEQLLHLKHWQEDKKVLDTPQSSETSESSLDLALLHQDIKKYDKLDPHETAYNASLCKVYYYITFESLVKKVQSDLKKEKIKRKKQARLTGKPHDSTPRAVDSPLTNKSGRTADQKTREDIVDELCKHLEKAGRTRETIKTEHNAYLSEGKVLRNLVIGCDPKWLLLFPLGQVKPEDERRPALDLMKYSPPGNLRKTLSRMLSKPPSIKEFHGKLKQLAEYFGKNLFIARPELRDIDANEFQYSNLSSLALLKKDDKYIRQVKPQGVAELLRRN